MKNIYKHMQNLDTKDVIEGLFNGRFPVKKQGAAAGEQDYYFYDYDSGKESPYPMRDPFPMTQSAEQKEEGRLSASDLEWNNRLEAVPLPSQPGIRYAQNMQTHSSDGTNTASQPIVSDAFLNQLGFDESSNNYASVNKSGSARGKYQMQKLALEDIGMIDKKGNWLGKYGVYSQNDFLNNPEAQEKAIHDFFNLYHKRYNQDGYQHIGKQIKGVSGETFPITRSGLLAAAHREGQGMVKRYINSLASDANGNYYMDYNNLLDDEKNEDSFRAIETRLRRYEKF